MILMVMVILMVIVINKVFKRTVKYSESLVNSMDGTHYKVTLHHVTFLVSERSGA